MNKQRNVAIMIFDQVEVLDFAGPLEVFNVAAGSQEPAPFSVYTVAESASPVKARANLSINPNYSIYAMPPADVLLIPGGRGSRALLHKPAILDWVQQQAEEVEYLLSVCTGSLILGKAGLLDGLPATTHHGAFDELEAIAPNCTIIRDQRYVDNDNLLTSGGIAAGIDMSLHVVRKLLGDAAVAHTISQMEYPWSPEIALNWPQQVKALKS